MEGRLEEEEVRQSQPSEVLALEALELGSTAWEDDGTLQWPIYVDNEIEVPGSVSAEIEARVKGPIPYAKTLVLVFPVAPFDLDEGGILGVARGVQWWNPGVRLKIKVVNKANSPTTITTSTQVARAVAVN